MLRLPLLFVLLPGSAIAATIEPSATTTLADPVSVIAFQEGVVGQSDEPLLHAFGNDRNTYTCDASTLACNDESTRLDWLLGSGVAQLHLTSAYIGRQNTVLTDACNGRVLSIGPNIRGELRLANAVDVFLRPDGDFDPLQRPAAAVALGDQLFFSAGEPTANSNIPDECGMGSLAPPHGALLQVDDPFDGLFGTGRSERDQEIIVAADEADYGFHPETTRGMAVYRPGGILSSELWTVSGLFGGDAGLETKPHVRRYALSGGGETAPIDEPIELSIEQAISGPAILPDGIGSPSFIAPLMLPGEGEPFMVIGTETALAVFRLDGRYLGPLWLETDTGGELETARRIVSVTADHAGGAVYVLFQTRDQGGDGDGDRGDVLAVWTSETIATRIQQRIIATPQAAPTCERSDDELICGSLQAAVARAWPDGRVEARPGDEDDGLFAERITVLDRPMNVVSEPPGAITIFEPDDSGSTVHVENIFDGRFILDGFVVGGGVGTPIDLGEGTEVRAGGGLLIDAAEVDVKRTLFVHNRADYGAGIWFRGSGLLRLENVGLVDNQATVAGGAISAFGGTEAAPEILFRGVSIAGNCAPEGTELANMDSVDLQIFDSILAFNGDGALPAVVEQSTVRIEDTLLYPGRTLSDEELESLGARNLSADPLFIALSDRDLQLESGSPAVFGDTQLGMYRTLNVVFTTFDETVTSYCDLTVKGGDDDDTLDDDDALDDRSPVPSGLRCSGCATASGAPAERLALLLLLLPAARRRR